MGRESGKGGKGRGGGGGGGGRGKGRKMFIENMDELAIRDREINEQQEARARRRAGSDEDDDDEDNADNDKDEVPAEGQKAETLEDNAASVFSFERKSRADFLKEKNELFDFEGEENGSDDEDSPRGLLGIAKPNNPNLVKKPAEKMLKAKDMNDPTIVANPEAGMNRKEREVLAALKAKEDYQRRHMAGETEQAKRELAKLAEVRARREAARLKREAEGRKPGMSATGLPDDFDLSKAKGQESSDDDDDDSDEEDGKPAKGKVTVAAPPTAAAVIAAKKKAAAAEPVVAKVSADGGPPKLKTMDIKKLNGDALKEHLKERKLDVQGQKKDLMKRLIDYEEARP